MEDNIQQPVPLQSESKSPEQPIIQDAVISPPRCKDGRLLGKRRVGILSQLPDDIRFELEKVMMEKSCKAARDWMIKNHSQDFPEAAKLSLPSYVMYKQKHNARIRQEMSLTKQLATPDPAVKGVIDAITNPDISLDDKRKALTALFNSCEARRQLLSTKQEGFIDPMIEGLILANAKEQRVIIEKVALLNEQLTKDSERDFLSELEVFYQVIIAAVSNTFRVVCGDTNYSAFISALDENLSQALKSYRMSKDRLKSEKK